MRELAPERKIALIATYDGQGFQAVLDVLDNIVLDSEDDLIGEPPGDKEKILALHAIAYAQRAMLTKAANQIDVLVAEARQGEKKDTLKRREQGASNARS